MLEELNNATLFLGSLIGYADKVKASLYSRLTGLERFRPVVLFQIFGVMSLISIVLLFRHFKVMYGVSALLSIIG